MIHISNYPGAKKYTSVHGKSVVGKSEVYITCPFCGDTVTAYLWSLAGGGKRCTCGAKHSYYGFTIPRKAK